MIKRIVVAGNRDYNNYAEAKEYIDFYIDNTSILRSPSKKAYRCALKSSDKNAPCKEYNFPFPDLLQCVI